jgi:hypothetical protein
MGLMNGQETLLKWLDSTQSHRFETIFMQKSETGTCSRLSSWRRRFVTRFALRPRRGF